MRQFPLIPLICLLTAYSTYAAPFVAADLPNAQPTPRENLSTPQPDIASLIRQLASSSFEERQAAGRALESLGSPALPALHEAAKKDSDPEVRRRAQVLVETLENRLDQLLVRYREYGLPLPPADAPLVRIESRPEQRVHDGTKEASYLLAFLLHSQGPDNNRLVLLGRAKRCFDQIFVFSVLTPAQPTANQASHAECVWQDSLQEPFATNVALATAIQCQARGWHELAQALLTRALATEPGDSNSIFSQSANLRPQAALSRLAWAHWANELAKRDTDRAAIAQHIRFLFASDPALATDDNRKFLTALDAALAPRRGKPGTTEALIDDLLDLSAYVPGQRDDARYQRLLDLGFAAIPSLIEHLDDQRLTRCIAGGEDAWPIHFLRICDVVSLLLEDLAGERWATQPSNVFGWPFEKASVQAWWQNAQKVGEEAQWLNHVWPEDHNVQWLRSPILELLAKKYPKHLPAIYRKVLKERPVMYIDQLTEAIGKSTLSRDQKRELLLEGTASEWLERKRSALKELKTVDRERFITILVQTLEAPAKMPYRAYWRREEALFASLVWEADDKRAWTALEKATRRADPDLRLQYLNALIPCGGQSGSYRPSLRFIAKFLDDTTTRDIGPEPDYGGVVGASQFPRIEVRNYAAMKIALALGWKVDAQPSWTAAQWEQFRDDVRKALAKQEAKPKPGGTR
jgi:hypothetical protein